jgi:hypothetical protein
MKTEELKPGPKMAELINGGKGFQIIVGEQVIIDVAHRTNLIKNFRNNKTLKRLGIKVLRENGHIIYDIDSKSNKRGRKPKYDGSKDIKLESKYAGILNKLLRYNEFRNADLLKMAGLKRPNAELKKDLDRIVGTVVEKINLGVGKGVVYKVI